MLRNIKRKFKVKPPGAQTQRPQWSSPNYFVLSLICWTCTITNTWRFPTLLYNYGNLQVMLPYVLVMVLMVMPMLLTELAIGQYTSRGVITMWKMSPLWKGLSYSSTMVLFCVSTYTLYVTTFISYYWYRSLECGTPWSYCKSSTSCYNATIYTNFASANKSDINSVQYYFEQRVMGRVKNFLFIFSTIPLIGIFALLANYLRNLQKMLNFLTIVPLLLVLVLLMTSISFRQGSEGILEMFKPDLRKLLDPNLWADVYTNNLMAMGLGIGGLICAASHNPFRSNIFAASVFVPIFSLISDLLFAAFVYSNFAGYTLWRDVPMENLWKYNASMLFVKIPLVLLDWPGYKQIWNLTYFTYLFLVSFRSLLFMVLTLISSLNEIWPLSQKYFKTSLISICVLIYCANGLYVVPFGYLLYTQLERLCNDVLLGALVALQFIGIYYIYNAKRLQTDIHFMLNVRIKYLEYIFYMIPIPATLAIGYNFYKWITRPRKCIYSFMFEIGLFSCVFLFWVVWFAYYVFVNWNQGVLKMMKSDKSWGCFKPDDQRNRELFQGKKVNEDFNYRQELNSRENQPDDTEIKISSSS